MTRSPKMTGTRPRRNCGRKPDIATASDTNPDRSVPSSLSLFLQSSCLPANMPTCQHTLHSINSGPTPRLRNDAEIKSIPSPRSFPGLTETSTRLPPFLSSVTFRWLMRQIRYINSETLRVIQHKYNTNTLNIVVSSRVKRPHVKLIAKHDELIYSIVNFYPIQITLLKASKDHFVTITWTR